MTGCIMIADDHPMFREGMLRTVQRLLPEAVVHEACDLGAMQALIHDAGEVDTLILDLRSRPDVHEPIGRTASATTAHHVDRSVDGGRPGADRARDGFGSGLLYRQKHRAR